MRRTLTYMSLLALVLNAWSVGSRLEQMHPGLLAGLGLSFLLTLLAFGFAILASGMYRQKSGSIRKAPE